MSADTIDPNHDALLGASLSARIVRQASARRLRWMKRAHEHGASLREISEATEIPHVTVKRMIDRAHG